MAAPTSTIDVNPQNRRRAAALLDLVRILTLIVAVCLCIAQGSLLGGAAMFAAYISGVCAMALAFTARTGILLTDAVEALLAISAGRKNGYIELSEETTRPEPRTISYGAKLRVLPGYNAWWEDFGMRGRSFARDGDVVRAVSTSSKILAEVYVMTDDGAHLTIPKMFLEEVCD